MTPISALEGYRNAPPDLAYLRARGDYAQKLEAAEQTK